LILNYFRYQNRLAKWIAYSALFLSLVAPIFAYAYTGVTIVINAPTATNLEFVEYFKNELVSTKNTNLRVNVVVLQESEKLVVAENSELVIALGVKALEASSRLKSTTPVLGVFTPLPAFNSLLVKSRRELGNFSAIVLDQPYSRQLSLIRAILPDAKKVGVLLGTVSSQYMDVIKDEGEERGFSVLDENVYQEADLIPKLKKLLENTDALLAIPDGLIYNRETAQPILLTSYRHQKPMFGYSQSYVRAGALASVYSSSKQMAKQAAEIAVKSQQAPSLLPPPQIPKYFSVTLNYQVAHSLNIPLMDEETLYKKMLEAEAIENQGHEEIRH
jgi:putative tryptophan/tyrosine transport system substrate-binding protein